MFISSLKKVTVSILCFLLAMFRCGAESQNFFIKDKLLKYVTVTGGYVVSFLGVGGIVCKLLLNNESVKNLNEIKSKYGNIIHSLGEQFQELENLKNFEKSKFDGINKENEELKKNAFTDYKNLKNTVSESKSIKCRIDEIRGKLEMVNRWSENIANCYVDMCCMAEEHVQNVYKEYNNSDDNLSKVDCVREIFTSLLKRQLNGDNEELRTLNVKKEGAVSTVQEPKIMCMLESDGLFTDSKAIKIFINKVLKYFSDSDLRLLKMYVANNVRYHTLYSFFYCASRMLGSYDKRDLCLPNEEEYSKNVLTIMDRYFCGENKDNASRNYFNGLVRLKNIICHIKYKQNVN